MLCLPKKFVIKIVEGRGNDANDANDAMMRMIMPQAANDANDEMMKKGC